MTGQPLTVRRFRPMVVVSIITAITLLVDIFLPVDVGSSVRLFTIFLVLTIQLWIAHRILRYEALAAVGDELRASELAHLIQKTEGIQQALSEEIARAAKTATAEASRVATDLKQSTVTTIQAQTDEIVAKIEETNGIKINQKEEK